MVWIELHQAVWTHRKTFELASVLGLEDTYAAAHVIRLWSWALDNAPDGDLSQLSARAIAYGAGWRGAAESFLRALVDVGWIDADHRIHDWNDYAGRLVDRRAANAARMRAARAAHLGSENGQCGPDVLVTSGARAGATGPNRTGPNRTGPNPTSPLPPPPAEGERNPRRRRSTDDGGIRGEDAVDAPPPEVLPLLPLAPADCQLWRSALEHLPSMTPGNREQVQQLEPLGRAPGGGLRLRAPPGHRLGRFRPQIARALADAGDAHGKAVQIVEG